MSQNRRPPQCRGNGARAEQRYPDAPGTARTKGREVLAAHDEAKPGQLTDQADWPDPTIPPAVNNRESSPGFSCSL
jgi:hypothetical protein